MFAVVEDEGAVNRAYRGVDRTERRGALDVDVDIAGLYREDPVCVAAKLALTVDLDRQTNVCRGNLVRDHLGSAPYRRVLVHVAVRQR